MQGLSLAASAASVDVTASMDFSSSLYIDFDNESDSESTVVTITGPDQHNLLLRITGALNSLGLSVKSASISVSEDSTVFDVFRVVNSADQKVNTPDAAAPLACLGSIPARLKLQYFVKAPQDGSSEVRCVLLADPGQRVGRCQRLSPADAGGF